MTNGDNRRGWPSRVAAGIAIVLSLAGAVVGGVLFGRAVSSPAETVPQRTVERPHSPKPDKKAKEPRPRRPTWPARGALSEARHIAESRSGHVSFAAIGPGDRTIGFEPDRQFFSASASKVMLLVAELRRLRREELPLDEQTRTTLSLMITLSDNAAADAIYARVGDAGLNEVAEITGMTHFAGDVGHWSNVQITAGDMALFMSKLDELLDLPGGDAASEMLASIHPSQSWGVPQAAPRGSKVRMKGGWRPSDAGELVHQAARVDVDRGGSYSVAVLTDGNPDMVYGEETIRLIAAELLRGSSRQSGGPRS